MRFRSRVGYLRISKLLNDKLVVGCFISNVSLCKNQQKQQKEEFFYFDWKPYTYIHCIATSYGYTVYYDCFNLVLTVITDQGVESRGHQLIYG